MTLEDPSMSQMQQHTPDDVMDRAEEMYERLRPELEIDENIGKLICIEVLMGDYEVGEDQLETVHRLRARHADPVVGTLRIGYEAVSKFGGGPIPRLKPGVPLWKQRVWSVRLPPETGKS